MSEETQEFWRGTFGDEYNERNEGMAQRNVAFFARILRHVRDPIKTVLEFGCGTGQNLGALDTLLPTPDAAMPGLFGIEINKAAAQKAREYGATIYEGAAADFDPPTPTERWDLVFSKGFLIHIPPDELGKIIEKMYGCSKRWILLAEYYNPTPVEVPYRGHAGRLWKRDFATEFIGRFPSLRVADYGFIWRHDYPWQQDDLTYFLLEKR